MRGSIAVMLLLFAVTNSGCASFKNSVVYTYTDMNNNTYHISRNEVRFDPVTASESSSGYYSGGTPFSCILSEKSFQKIASLAEALVEASETHNSQRVMRTAVLVASHDGQPRRVILNPSEERVTLENLLASLRPD
ncbi:hypothetical protein [Altibacter sp.]|uniref:hypothetical protein n=1 Tax=Altibacter sp. TaxID=2024823 RepID=UPI00258B7134|nr:hypothetical protein [Altibacter sp.]MCW9037729.1 hypothetical protein [Altibacter sp.]